MSNMFLEVIKFSTGTILLACLVCSAPTRTLPSAAVQRQQKLFNIQRLELEIENAAAAGRLREAVRLEQRMENEIVETALEEIFLAPGGSRDGKFLKELLRRDSRAVSSIADRLVHGSEHELAGVRDQLKRDKRSGELLSGILGASSGGGGTSDSSSSSADSDSEGGGSAGVLSLVSSLLGASSGSTNRVARSIREEENEVDGALSDSATQKEVSETQPQRVHYGLIGGVNLTKTNTNETLTGKVIAKKTKEESGSNGRVGFAGPGEFWGSSSSEVSGLPHPSSLHPVGGFPPSQNFAGAHAAAAVIDITNEVAGGDISSYFDKPVQTMGNSLHSGGSANILAGTGGTMFNRNPSGGSDLSGGVNQGSTEINQAAAGSIALNQAGSSANGMIGAYMNPLPQQGSLPLGGTGLVGGVSQGGGGGSGLIGGVSIGISGNGLVGGTSISNGNAASSQQMSNVPQGGTGLIGGVNQGGGAGLIGGVSIYNSGNGLIGGAAISNGNVASPQQTSNIPQGGTGLIGGLNQGGSIGLIGGAPIGNKGNGLIGGITIFNGNGASFSQQMSSTSAGGTGLIGGVSQGGTGLIGGATVQNVGNPPVQMANLPAGGTGLIGGTQGVQGLVGGVPVGNGGSPAGNGLIGGITITNSAISPMQSGSITPQSTGLIGGVSQGAGGLIGGVPITNTGNGLIGGTNIANGEMKPPPDPGYSYLPPGGNGLIGGINQGDVPVPSVDIQPPPKRPHSGGNDIFSGIDFGNGYKKEEEEAGVTGVITGVVRPIKDTEGGGGGSDGGGGGGGGGSDLLGLLGPLSSSSSGGGDDGGGGSDLLGTLLGLLGPLSSSSSGGGGDGDEGGGSDLLGLLGPLSSSSSGGGDDGDGGGSDLLGTLAGLLGPLSSSSSGGGADEKADNDEGGGSGNLIGSLLSLAGPLSSSSSGGGSDGQGGAGGGIVSGLLGSSSGGGGDGDGAGGGGSDVSSLLSGVLGSSSGGGGDGDGGGGSDVGSLLTGVLGSSSGGGGGGTLDLTGGTAGSGDGIEDGGDDEAAGTGSNIVGAVSGILGSSSGGGDLDGDGGGGSNVLSLITSVLGASSSGGTGFGGGNSEGGGGSGGILSSLLGASSGGGDGQGADGGGSLIGSLLGGSSGGGGSGGTSDFKGQLLSTLFRIKFAIFRSLLSLVTGFLGSSSGAA